MSALREGEQPDPDGAFQLTSGFEQFLRKTLFFIGCFPKSGSTWLQFLLNAHPQICCDGESHVMNHLSPMLVGALQKHNALVELKNRTIFSEFPPFPLFGDRHIRYLIRVAFALLMMQIDGAQSAQVVGEKTPNHLFHFTELRTLFPPAKFVHIVRDGRDCLVSAWFHSKRTNPAALDRRHASLDAFVAQGAVAWKGCVEAGLKFCHAAPDQSITVRYEELTSDTPATFAAVVSLLGADADAELIRQCVAQADFKAMSGGRERGAEQPSSFLRQGLPGNWKHHLSAEGNRAFLAVAGGLIEELGWPR